ncbi:MAG: LacI family DNA-binding transcriptional regulator, partial [Actinobacteria bacterium]|nr:LacI family DNA-binding transcriptional regulator [Actinomycetota bacterium]
MTHVPEPAVASPPTLRDVAEHAGVSTATASNALT